MPRTMFWTAVGVLILLSVNTVEGGEKWVSHLDEAKRLAEASGKDLLILFTGTEWCKPCLEFERVVLTQPDFTRTSEPFVLAKLEFPVCDEKLPQDRAKDLIAWRGRYGIRVFPTVLLANATGRPYAVTGYAGLKASEYMRHVDRLRRVREQRDAAFLRAANARGLEKARFLNEALSVLSDAFDKSYTEKQGDMLVRFYRPQIDQILALDSTNDAGLRDKYAALLG